MKPSVAHIIFAAVCACCLISGCGSRDKVIPSGVMSDIYFDMFLVDRWISADSDRRRKADSTLVYEPIFNRYGYTTADYDKSVSYYLARPEEYLKIAERTAERFKKESDRLEKERSERAETEQANSIFNHYPAKNFEEDSVRWSFGVMKEKIDSILTEHKWIISQENTDTLQTKQGSAQ